MNKIKPKVDGMQKPTLGWLADLENQRENTRGKLAHEFGAGAQCHNCDNCTGLELHFWRKTCRMCKCSGDQHDCNENDLVGYMQFEILGQKRSTPGYVNIKKVSERVDWIPPNIDNELITEYINDMEADYIPITGSKASMRRKIRLNHQVPLHDLDPSLCHSLTEIEASQLKNYVGQIKEHNVGQGIVVRVEDIPHANKLNENVPALELKSSIESTSNEFFTLFEDLQLEKNHNLKKTNNLKSSTITCKACRQIINTGKCNIPVDVKFQKSRFLTLKFIKYVQQLS
ncbi:testin-like isoform X2 [Contarinia nasturtii]|uniref:testin-like isoform X2 n=1 Tax=Contarinia nasturtii TaxID=265458 RepID=UPI0012D3B107|nr:testin-like isoform X2 [Contarinia nasturtii]